MRNLIGVLGLMMLVVNVKAQVKEADTTKLKVKSYEIIIVENEDGEVKTEIKKVEGNDPEQLLITNDLGKKIRIVRTEEEVDGKMISKIKVLVEDEGDGEDDTVKTIEFDTETLTDEMMKLGREMKILSEELVKELGEGPNNIEINIRGEEGENVADSEEKEIIIRKEKKGKNGNELKINIDLDGEEEDVNIIVQDNKKEESMVIGDPIQEREVEIIEEEEEHKNNRGKYKLRSNWGGLGFGFEGLSSRDAINTNDFINENRGFAYSWEFFAISAHLGTPYVALTTGLGAEWIKRDLNDDFRIDVVDDVAVGVKNANISLSKNTVSQTVLNIPAFLEFSTSTHKRKNVRISVGYIQRIILGTRAKYDYAIDGRKHQEKVKDDFNFARYRGALSARVGYRGITAFATYDLDPLFEDNKGPVLYPLTFGFNLSLVPTVRWNIRKSRT